MFYKIKIPKWFRWLNKRFVWKVSTKEKILYLTFDDGPHETATPFVLDQLKNYNAKATFFCLGKNVQAYPEIYKRILDEGHATGNHTFNHLNGLTTKRDVYIDDILKAAECIQSNLFRPPYGKISPFTANILKKKFGYKIVMWDVLSADFDPKNSPEKCLQNVLGNVERGSVIVFHDSTKAWNAMQFALPNMLKKLSEDGYNFQKLY